MRIIFLRRRMLRLLVLVLIMIFILPLLYFFITSAVNPASVHFREPLGDAVKVFDPEGENQSQLGILNRLFYYIRDFYQNKL